MDAEETSKISSERSQWKKIFNTLVQMLHTQQQQLETLVKERELFQDQFKIQHDRWVSDVQTLEDQIFQMKKKISVEERVRFLEIAKSELFLSLRQSESLLYQKKIEFAESDLGDFRLCFADLAQKLSEQNLCLGDKDGKCDKGVEGTDSRSEVSALLLERDFVWNQFKIMESDYTGFRKSRQIEVEQASEKIDKLLSNMEQLQSSSIEKDKTIEKLKADLAKLESDSNNEISRLSKEVELLRNLKGPHLTPTLNSCTTRTRTVSMETQKTSRDRKIVLQKESPGSDASGIAKKTDKESKGSKRKEVQTILNSDTPRLFSSRFKVPKLKNSTGRPLS